MRRPLFVFGIIFSLLLAAGFCSLLTPASGALLVLMIAAYLTLRDQAKKRDFLVVGLAALAGAATVFTLHTDAFEKACGRKGEVIAFTGYVSETASYDSSVVTIAARDETGKRCTLRMTLSGEEVSPGDGVAGKATVYAVRREENGVLGGGILLSVRADGQLAPCGENFGLLQRAAVFRTEASELLHRTLPAQSGAFLSGVLLSESSALSEYNSFAVSRAGVGHLLSVSGLHMSVVVGTVLFLLRGRSKKLRFLSGLAVILLVWILAGFRLTALRTAVMHLLFLAAQTVGRRSDALTSLSVAAVVIAILSPSALLGASFQLSFAATLSLVLLSGPMEERLEEFCVSRFGKCPETAKVVIGLVSVSTAAQIGVLPVVLLRQGYLSTYALISNLLLWLPGWLMLVLGMPGLFLGLLLPAPNANPLLWLADRAAAFSLAVCRAISALPGASAPMLHPVPVIALCTTVVLVVLLICLRREGRGSIRKYLRIASGCSLALLLVSSLWLGTGTTVLSDSKTGLLMIRGRQGTMLCAETLESYDRYRARMMLLCIGSKELTALLWQPDQEQAAPQWMRPVNTLDTNCLPPEIDTPAPEMSEIYIGERKLLKLSAGYGIITENEIPPDAQLLCDYAGLLYAPQADYTVYSHFNGLQAVYLR